MIDMLALAAMRRGDEKALAQIIGKYTPYVTTIIRGILGVSPQDVEETSADVFFSLWQNADKPNPLKLKAYLGAIARNKAKNRLRQMRDDIPLEDDLIASPDESMLDNITLEDERRAVKRAVLSMRDPDREIFLRHYYLLQSVSKIAADMNMGQSAVKQRLSRGREKLKEELVKGGKI